MYDPDRVNPRILVSRCAGWSRDGGVALVRFVEAFADRDLRPDTNFRFVFLGLNREQSDTVAGLARPFGYTELRRYRAGIFFPWDMGMLLFSELYAIGVPLLIPSRAWMASIVKRMLEYTDFGWWQVRHDTAVSLPDAPSPTARAASWATGGREIYDGTWPWLDANSTIARLLELYDRTDFVRWPHVTSFASIPQMMSRVRELDFDATSEAMREFNTITLEKSLGILTEVLASLLDGSHQPSQSMSSCI